MARLRSSEAVCGDQAAYDWIFSLDADERVSDELKASIARLREQPETSLADGYRIRAALYQGRGLKVAAGILITKCGCLEIAWSLGATSIHESVKLIRSADRKASGDIQHTASVMLLTITA